MMDSGQGDKQSRTLRGQVSVISDSDGTTGQERIHDQIGASPRKTPLDGGRMSYYNNSNNSNNNHNGRAFDDIFV